MDVAVPSAVARVTKAARAHSPLHLPISFFVPRRVAARVASCTLARPPAAAFRVTLRRAVPVRLPSACVAGQAARPEQVALAAQGSIGVVPKAVPIPSIRTTATALAAAERLPGRPQGPIGPEVAATTKATALRVVVPVALVPLARPPTAGQAEVIAEPTASTSPPVAERQADAVPQDAVAVRQSSTGRLELVAAGHTATTPDVGP